MHYYLGEFWQENVQKILSLCQTQHFRCVFVLVGNRRASCPAPCLELPTQLGTWGDLQPLWATPVTNHKSTEALHIPQVSWDIFSGTCMVFSRGEMKVRDQEVEGRVDL